MLRTKVTRLTPANVRALRECVADYLTGGEAEGVEIGATIATFRMRPADALELVTGLADRAAAEHGRRGHPVASLQAVRRKLTALADAVNHCSNPDVEHPGFPCNHPAPVEDQAHPVTEDGYDSTPLQHSPVTLQVLRQIQARDPEGRPAEPSAADRAEFRMWVLETFGPDAWAAYHADDWDMSGDVEAAPELPAVEAAGPDAAAVEAAPCNVNDLTPFTRVEIPAYADEWAQGDRYGEIRGALIYRAGGNVITVKLDKSGRRRRFLARDLRIMADAPAVEAAPELAAVEAAPEHRYRVTYETAPSGRDRIARTHNTLILAADKGAARAAAHKEIPAGARIVRVFPLPN